MTKEARREDEWMGFSLPNTTPTPNEFYDRTLARIDNLSELKCVLYVIRRTYGFAKLIDRISHSQFISGITKKNGEVLDLGTGLSAPAVSKGLQKAVAHGHLMRYIICPHCLELVTDRVVIEYQMTPRKSKDGNPITVKKDAPPYLCPHCKEQLRGKEEIYYSLCFANEQLDYTILKSLVWHHKDFSKGLHKTFRTQEIVVQEKETRRASSKTTSKQEPTVTEPVTEKKVDDYIGMVAAFAAGKAPPRRERVRDALAGALGVEVPESGYMLKPWESAVDSLVIEFRKVFGKGRLDDALTEAIVGAIGDAKGEDGWHMCKGPSAAVVGRVVAAGRNGREREGVGEDLAARQAGEKARMQEMARAHGHG